MAPAQLAQFSDRVVAGAQNDVMIVRHLVIRGSNVAIGRKLAEIARSQHHAELAKADPLVAQDQWKWLSANYPERIERAKGVEDAYGVSAKVYDPTILPIDMAMKPACSVVYYPGRFVTNHHAMLSRNYDFRKSTFNEIVGMKSWPGERSWTGDPYVIEMYPDHGYASLYTCAYDLEGGAIDGVNSRGVTVALLADDMSKKKTRGRAGYGLSELDTCRFVLDRAGSAAQARTLLRNVPYNATFTPCHYIIGDTKGDSFIFEVGPDGHHYIINGGRKPQIVTNHSIAEYGTTHLPEGNSFDRYRALQKELGEETGKYTPAEVKSNNFCVAVPGEVGSAATMWHAVYDLNARTVQISFCLSRPDEAKERRTPYLRFALQR